jgi:hypothetical protein
MIAPEIKNIEIDGPSIWGGTNVIRYGNADGYFFLYGEDSHITHVYRCRVEFAWKFGVLNKFIGFSHQYLNIDRVNEFFKIVEDRLGLRHGSVFYRTNYIAVNTIVIKPSSFWLENETKRSLFTLFLRCAVEYYLNDFNEALNKYELAKKTIPAIEWFLSGNTKTTYEKMTQKDQEGYGGWVAEFQYSSHNELQRQLIKEDKKCRFFRRLKPLLKVSENLTVPALSA